jgi:hypothetical protein
MSEQIILTGGVHYPAWLEITLWVIIVIFAIPIYGGKYIRKIIAAKKKRQRMKQRERID